MSASSTTPSAPTTPPLRPSRPPPPDELKDVIDSINESIRARRPPLPSKTDERCYTFTSQTNRRRAQGLPANPSSFCYINFRSQLESIDLPLGEPPRLTPTERRGEFIVVPGDGKGVESLLVRDKGKERQEGNADEATTNNRQGKLVDGLLEMKRPPSAIEEGGPIVPSYHWQWLDRRYIYYGVGRETVINHMKEMGGEDWKGMDAMVERCEKGELERSERDKALGRRGRREQRNVRLALGFPDEREDYEKLINLSTVYSNSLRRFHTHLLRIYSPVFANIQRLPETFRDGTQTEMLKTVRTRLTDGSALKLAERMYSSTREVIKTFRERTSGGSSSGSIGGGGGGASPL